jgi:hypothetical protein
MSETHVRSGPLITEDTCPPPAPHRERARHAPARNVKLSARNRYNATLKLLRRAHLFTGLFMTPWVFLYAVSGFLFNHPDAFPDRQFKPIGRGEIAGTDLESFPTAPAIAARVIEAMNAESSSRSLRLVEPESAEFSRDLIATAAGKQRGTSYRIQLSLGSGQGTVSPARATRPGIHEDGLGGKVQLPDLPRDRLPRAITALSTNLGLEPTTASVKTVPDVVFNAELRGKVYRISYNLRSGTVSALDDADATDRLTTRSFLTQLHKKRTFPERIDSRWLWAVGVDAISALMLFWGVSGVLMWWQIRSMRGWGCWVLAASGATATVLALALYRVLSMT